MKAIHVTAFGGPEVLALVDVEPPEPKAGEVLIRTAAAGINYMDVGNRKGRPGQQPGFILGGEGAGTVEALGPGVTGVSIGDRVMHVMVPGSYAEYQAVPADRLIPIPAELDFIQAAALPLQAITAHYLLHDYTHVGPGRVVLVHAVAGGVGLLLTQMATHMGAHVIGTTSSAAKAEKARAMGARDVILYTETPFAPEVLRITGGAGADLILDAVSKATFAGDMEAVARFGTIVIFGGASGQADPVSPHAFGAKAARLGGGSLGNFILTRAELLRRADAVIAMLRAGTIKLTIDRVLPLAEAADAHRAIEGRTTSGKLVLVP